MNAKRKSPKFCVTEVKKKNKSVALQLWRAKTDWSGCCQMAVKGALWLAKHLSLNLTFSFLSQSSLLLISSGNQLSSRGWVDPIPDPILPEKFLGYCRESNPGPLWMAVRRANHYTKQVVVTEVKNSYIVFTTALEEAITNRKDTKGLVSVG